MKTRIKLIVLALLASFQLFNCSNDDETNDLTQLLNPPSWIRGTWLQTDIGSQGFSTEFVFTENNVKHLVDGDVLDDFGMYGNNPTSGHSFEQEELTNSSSAYEIRRTHRYNGTILNDLSWKWIKESDTNIRHELGTPNSSNPIVKFYEKE